MVFTKFVVPSFLGETFLQYFFAAVKQETDDVVEEKMLRYYKRLKP